MAEFDIKLARLERSRKRDGHIVKLQRMGVYEDDRLVIASSVNSENVVSIPSLVYVNELPALRAALDEAERIARKWAAEAEGGAP